MRGRPRYPSPETIRRLTALLLALAGAACISRSPGAEDWLETQHRTPRGTLEAFQNALAEDLPDLEYRCLSAGFRAEHGVSSLTYREARGALPFYRKLADAKVAAERPLGEGSVEFDLVLRHLFGSEHLRVRMIREEFVEIYAENDRVHDERVALEESVSIEGRDLTARVPLPRGLELGMISEWRLGREWKIDAVEFLEDPQPQP